MARDFSARIRSLCFPENLRKLNLSAKKRAGRSAHLTKHRLAFLFSPVQQPTRDWLRTADLRLVGFLRSPGREAPAELPQFVAAKRPSIRALARTGEPAGALPVLEVA